MQQRLGLTNLTRQRGDTLVEVMISIAVISLVLGGAYVTTNSSLLATRAAQERGIALKLAESQLERLKAAAANPATSSSVFNSTGAFCISTAGAVVAASHGDCVLSTAGTAASASTQPAFDIEIVRTGNSFALTETWANVSGNSQDKLQLTYRLYE